MRCEIESIIADPVGVVSQAAAPAPLWKRAVPLLVTAGLTAAILGGGILYLKPKASPPSVTRFPLILGAGQQFLAAGRTMLAISLDGTQMVYVANRRLYLRLMSETEARPIPGTENSNAQGVLYFLPMAVPRLLFHKRSRDRKNCSDRRGRAALSRGQSIGHELGQGRDPVCPGSKRHPARF